MRHQHFVALEGGTLVDTAYHSLRHDIITG